PFELVGQERGVGGNNNNDGAFVFHTYFWSRDFFSHRNSSDAQVFTVALIGLDQNTNGIRPRLADLARGRPNSSGKIVTSCSRAAPDIAFLDLAATGAIQGPEHMIFLDVEAGNVAHRAIPNLGHNRQVNGIIISLHGPFDDRVADGA